MFNVLIIHFYQLFYRIKAKFNKYLFLDILVEFCLDFGKNTQRELVMIYWIFFIRLYKGDTVCLHVKKLLNQIK